MLVKDIAKAIGARIIGDEGVEVRGIASIVSAVDGDVVFVEGEKFLSDALRSRAAVVVAGTFAEKTESSKPLLIVPHPKLAFARAAALLGAGETRAPGIDPRAVVPPSVVLGDSVTIDPWTLVGDKARIGDRTWIGANCVISRGLEIGKDCKIYPNVTIYPGTRIGNRVIVHAGAVLGSDGFGYVRDPETGRHEKFPQIGKLEIEDDVEVGANTTIDRGALEVTRIGRGTKIDNLVHIGHNCLVGENVLIAAQAGFSGSITIENNVVIGGQVGVGEHARIQEGVMLGGQAGVLPKKVLRGKGVPFWGTPAKPLREYLRSLAALARLGHKENGYTENGHKKDDKKEN
ncbi:MAG TPA: UDP-3-O-(3-hydroxymyristoyl)glucosamine N-acyltransferase [Terriglobales bacterium]|nr:UDP-3-O-(3-hydroxymyristoyl)glucosamine N-acyltransferase [Terriglobales bacterium]